jgi:GAF domain-containing protein
MGEWQGSEDLEGHSRRDTLAQGRRALVRLRWGLRIAALVGLVLLELFYILALHRSAQEVFLDLLIGGLLSLGLIQICFGVVFRLYGRVETDRERLAVHLLRLHQLYALSQRLTTSLSLEQSDLDTRPVAHEPDSQARGLEPDRLVAALESLTAIFAAERASLLLLDDRGQVQEFATVGLGNRTDPGPQPGLLSTDEMPLTELDSQAWTAYLMPGVEKVTSFVAAPIVSGERLWGFLALADGKPVSSQDRSLLHTFCANLGVQLDNALLFQETQHKLVEAATLAQVSHDISSKLTQEELLPFLAQSLMVLLDGTACLITLRHPHTGELETAAVYARNPEGGGSRRAARGYNGLVRAVMERLEPLAIEDISGSELVDPALENQGAKSVLGLPLIVQGQAAGAIVVAESREQRRFTEDEIGRAMVVVNQGAVSIANARLFREVERRLVELGTLAEISRVVFSQLQSPEIYQRVVDELARAFGYPYVAFYWVEDDKLELGAQVGYATGRIEKHEAWGRGLVGRAAATGQTSYVPDVGALTDHESAADDVVSQIALPLRKSERVLGVLSVESNARLTEADLSLLQSLSYQVTMAVENARLYAAEQREREIARTLLQIAGDLSGTLHLDEVLQLILERLRVVVPYDSAAIGLLAGDACYVAAAHDLPRARRLWGDQLSPDDVPLVSRVLGERNAVIVADTSEAEDWVVIEGGEDIRSWLGVPLVVQDRTIGLLMLNHSERGFYGQQAAQLALAFAQHAALAIDNARLYEQIEATLQEQTLLHEMTTTVSSTLDAGRVLRLLTERLVAILGVTSARIATLDEENRSANLVAAHSSAEANEAEQTDELREVYDLTLFPVTAERLLERKPVQVIEGEVLEEWQDWMRRRAGQAVLFLPLVARDRVTGFVELWDSRSRRRFTTAEITLAQTLINPAAVAIDNARLFAETQRSISEMMLLYDIAVAAASTLELETVLQSVVKTLQFRVLEKSTVAVWLYDQEQQALTLWTQAGVIGPSRKTLQRLDEGLCGRVMQTGQPVLVGDAGQDAACSEYGPDVSSVLCVPLGSGHRVVGVLEALSEQKEAYTGNDLRLLRTMAGSLAMAVENVRLFTELKRSEEALVLRNEALELANDRLQELDRLKSAFIASVSHELRTPLNSIIGFSEVVLDGLAGELEPLAREYLGYIHDSGKHLLDLINDILDLSRIQAGRMTLRLEDVDVVAVVEDVRTTLAPMMSKKKHAFGIEKVGALPSIVADRFRLKQILINLIGNAVKFTPEEGQIRVRVSLVESLTVRIDVIDNGPGIAVEDQSMIFEDFRQAGPTRPGEGTGLGLAITRRLVHLHGGRIWVESQPGAGAVFTILLPVGGPIERDVESIEVDAGEAEIL